MNARLIKTEADHAAALARIDAIFGARPDTPDGDELELLVHLVEAYEGAHHAIEPPDPIEAIRFRMEQDRLKQTDLTPFIGSKSKVSEVLSGKRPLSLAMIRALHKGLGIPAHVLIQEPGKTLSPVYEGVNWQDFPLAEMIKRQWFPDFKGRVKDLCERAEEVLGPLLFPGGSDCRETALAARRHVRRGSAHDDHALWAWQARVLQLAGTWELGAYDAKAMTPDFIRSVVCLSGLDDGPVQARRLLASAGVGVVVLHYLPGTHLDGAAMLRHDGHPIVAVTLRYDRLDNFWFTLAHELAHVVLHLARGDTSTFMDDLEAKPSSDNLEQEADNLAANSLIPAEEWRRARVVQAPTEVNIRELAVRTRVHPAIVAGRIRFERGNYRILNHMVGRRAVRRLFPAYRCGEAA
ncbi:MAG: ImmA/IrrE family metallo-endopeptidase [Kiritimatiellae bacterium]|nr:ImmA/IrrE family metallo-endopeptidase [Kiritimatiellia bacterium]